FCLYICVLTLYSYNYVSIVIIFLFIFPPPPCSTLFPYTTLFRSLLDNAPLNITPEGNPRKELARWMISHPYFAEAAVNRMWGYLDRKSTRLNSSHGSISYAVFCLKNIRERSEIMFQLVSCVGLTL